MAVSVDQLFSSFGLSYEGPFLWNEKIKANYNGVYVITLSPDANSTEDHAIDFELCRDTISYWLTQATKLEVEGKIVTGPKIIQDHLQQFWNDENILYIGASSSKTNPLSKRIKQYYVHKVGQKGPHTGGYWLKLLKCLPQTYIYYAKADYPNETEFKMLMKFVELSAAKSFYELENFSNYFPFANLKVDVFKKHSLKKHTNDNKRG